MDRVFKCKIINYQRIKTANMEFIPGLNVIVGESNNGKTAILRALETAIYNIPREDHITLGETKSAVGIQYNGHEVIWRRDKEKASQVTYRVDGKIYQKLGRGQPQEVAESLGIEELDINDKKFRLNFSKQMSYPFLLDSTPSDMFKFIAQSSGEDNLIEVLKQMKKDVNEIASNVKVHEETQKLLGESLVQIEKRYNLIKDNKKYCDEVISLDSKVKSYQELKDKIETYKKCEQALSKMNNSMTYLKGFVNDISSSISVIDSHIKRFNEIHGLIDNYYSHKRDFIQYNSDLTFYNSVVNKLSELDSYYEKFRSQNLNTQKYENLSYSLTRFRGYQTTLSECNEEYSSLSAKVKRYDSFVEALGKVLEIKEEKSKELKSLQESVNIYKDLESQGEKLRNKINLLEEDVKSYQIQIEEIGVCPYCGSVLEGGSHGRRTDKEQV